MQRRRVDREILGGEIVLAVADILGHVEQYRSRPARGRNRKGAGEELGNAGGLLDPDQFLDRGPQYFDLAAFLGHVFPGMGAVGVAGKGDDRGPGVQRLDQAGDEVGGAGAEGAVAHAGPVGDAGIGFGGKGAAALVVDQEMAHAELAERVIERQQLEAAHAEHRPDPGQPQHLGHGTPAIHPAGGAVAGTAAFAHATGGACTAGFAHRCSSRSWAFSRGLDPRTQRCGRSRQTRGRLRPGVMPSAAAQELTRVRIPSS